MSALQRFELPVREPFPWAELLGYFRSRLIDGVESVEGGVYERREGGQRIVVGFDAQRGCLSVEIEGGGDAQQIRERVACLFSPRHDSREIEAALSRDPLLAPRIARCPGFRPLGCWSPFELAVRTVIGQQVTVAAAGTLLRRLIQRCGALTPAAIAGAELSALGMPGKRVATIRGFAEAVWAGDVRLDHRPWTEIDAQLSALPGFGPWTRGYLAIRLGRDTDAFPESDIGLMRAAGAASPRELLRLAEAWRPYRAHAATLLWAVAP